MSNVRPLLASISILLFMASVSQAKAWRGIVPLYSTRADVERILGKPNAKYERYDIENEQAQITYSRDRCANGWNVPRDTVVAIAVTFHQTVRLSDLGIDVKKFQRETSPHLQGHTYYSNKDEGIRYVVVEEVGPRHGVILEVYYGPNTNDEHLYCPSSTVYPNQPCPTIAVSCAETGDLPLTFSLNYTTPERKDLTFKWTVSAGTISEGQGTPMIKVTAGLGTTKITATVRIDGFPKGCSNAASCTAALTKSTATIQKSKPCSTGSTRRASRRAP